MNRAWCCREASSVVLVVGDSWYYQTSCFQLRAAWHIHNETDCMWGWIWIESKWIKSLFIYFLKWFTFLKTINSNQFDFEKPLILFTPESGDPWDRSRDSEYQQPLPSSAVIGLMQAQLNQQDFATGIKKGAGGGVSQWRPLENKQRLLCNGQLDWGSTWFSLHIISSVLLLLCFWRWRFPPTTRNRLMLAKCKWPDTRVAATSSLLMLTLQGMWVTTILRQLLLFKGKFTYQFSKLL